MSPGGVGLMELANVIRPAVESASNGTEVAEELITVCTNQAHSFIEPVSE